MQRQFKPKNLFLLTSLWLILFLTVFASLSGIFNRSANQKVEAASSSTVNFQARLLSSSGNLVPDGYYNVQFKLYSVSSGGTAEWTETYYDSNGVTAGNDNRVRVVNGYLSVYLGSQTAFPGTINWDQEQWVTINIGGTTQTATPTWDGEMSPRLQLTAVPYAFRAGQLAKLTGANTSTLDFATQTGARSILLPDESGTLCIQSSTNCGFAAASGSGNYIQNTTSLQASSNFHISGDGTADTSLTTPLLQAPASTALTITGNAASTWSTTSGNLTIQAGSGVISLGTTTSLTSSGALAITAGAQLTLQSTSSNALTIDSGTTGAINIGTGSNAKTITIGNGTSTTSVVINNGTGALNIGTNAVAHTITLGNSTGATSVVLNAGTGAVNIGTNAVAHTVTVGSTTGAATTTIQAGSGGINLNNGTIATNATTLNLFQATATTINLGSAVGAGGINLAGGSGSTGCTIDGSNGNLTCSGDITGAATGTVGYWTRSGTTLQPANAGDDIQTSGNISTTGSGAITAAGILNANATGKTAITIADSGAQNSGLTIGGDTNLYRSAANTLATDDNLSIGGNITAVNNITLSNPGVGNDSRITFTKTNDHAWINVNETVADQTTYGFYMDDNPDSTTDQFLWQINDWKGSGGSWQPLQFSGMNANIRGANINAYGDYNIYGPWYSGANGQPNSVYENKSGTLTVTPDVSGYTGSYAFYWVKIDGTGSPNTFSWGKNTSSTTGAASATNVPITGSAQTLDSGVTVTFNATTGGVLNDRYEFRVFKGGDLTADGTIQGTTVNATSALQLNGANINTAGTLSNVAYLNQANSFSQSQTISNAGGKTTLALTSTGSNTGITIGGDTNLYRSAANTLTTDDSFVISGSQFTNNASTLNTAQSLGNFASGGAIGTAAATVDVDTSFAIAQTTAGQVLSLPNPTDTTAGRLVFVLNTGTASFTMHGVTIPAGYGQIYIWNGSSWILGASGGGSAITLQAAYDGGNTLTTSDARDISVTLANTTTDANFLVNVASGSTGQFKVQNSGSDVLTIGSAGQLALTVQGSSGGLQLGGDTLLYRSAANTISLGSNDSLAIPGGDLSVDGGDITTAATTFNLLNATATTVNAFGAATAINIGAAGATITGGGALTLQSGAATALAVDSGTTGALNIGTSANAKTVTIGNGTGATAVTINSGTGQINIGSNAVAHAIVIGNGTGASSLTLQAGTGAINIGTNAIARTIAIGNSTGASTLNLVAGSGGINLNNATVATNATTLALFNTTATTINLGGAVGSGGINLAGGSSSTGCTIDGSNGNLTCSGAIATTATTGTQGWWTRSGTTLSPVTTGDSVRVSNAGGELLTLQSSAGGTYLDSQSSASNDWVVASKVLGDSNQRYTLKTNGEMQWGDGTNINMTLTQSSGSITIQPASATYNSTTAFRIQNSSGTNLLNVDTSNGGVLFGTTGATATTGVGQLRLWGTGTNGAGSKIFFGDGNDTTNNNVWIGEHSNTDTDQLLLKGDAGILFDIGDSSEWDALSIDGGNGSALFQNSSDTTTGFQIQDQSGDPIFNVDTSNQRLGVNTVAPQTEVQVCGQGANCSEGRLSFGDYNPATWQGVFVGEYGTGDTDILQLQGGSGVNITTGDLADVVIANFDSTGDTVTDEAYATFNDRAIFGYDGTTQDSVIKGIGGKGFKLYTDNHDSTSYSTFSVDTNGAVIFKNYTDTTTAFQIQNATSTQALFSVDTSNGQTIIRPPSGTGSGVGKLVINSNWSDSSGDEAQLLFGEGADSGVSAGKLYYTGVNNTIRLGGLNGSGTTTDVLTFDRSGAGVVLQSTNTVNINSTGANNITLAPGGTTNTGVVIKPSTNNSTAAFSVQNQAGTSHILDVNTTNGTVSINSTAPTSQSLYVWAGTSREGIMVDQDTSSTSALLRLQHNSSNVLQVASTGNVTAGGSSTGTTKTTEATARTSVTTVTLTSAGFANNDVIRLVRSGTYYYTRIVSGGGTTTLTVSPAVSYDASSTVTKYNVQYLGNDGSTFTGTTRSDNSYFQGYFTGGIVTGTGSTIYSDGSISSVNDLLINAASSTTFKNTSNSTSAFQIQNTAGSSIFTADTTNSTLTVANLRPSTAGATPGAVNNLTTVDSSNTVGYYSSVALGSDGYARIAYYYNTGADLKFAQCTNAACSTSNITTLDTTGTVGQYTSIAMGSDGYARIAYYDTTNTALKFVQCTNADCSTNNITTVDNTATVGLYTSIAMGSDGYARIAYYDATNTALKFAQCTNDACSTSTITTVDNTATVGLYTSIAMGSDGYARITEQDTTNSKVRFVQCTNAACSTSNQTALGSSGYSTSVAIAPDGFARISYLQLGTGPQYVQCTNASCSTNVITSVSETTVSGVDQQSMILGSDGYGRILFWNQSDSYNLHLIQCTNITCSTNANTVVENIGNGNSQTGMVLGNDGYMYLSYYTATGADLHLAQVADTALGTSIGSSSSPFGQIHSTGINVQDSFKVDGLGHVVIQNSADSTNALQIQNVAGTTLFAADTSNKNINITSAALNVTAETLTAPTGLNVTNLGNTGGSLSGANTYYYKVTAVTSHGESPTSSESSIVGSSSFTQISAPASAPTVAVSGTSGNVWCSTAPNDCQYYVTFVTNNGETTSGPLSSSITNSPLRQINLTNIPTGPTGTVQREIYLRMPIMFGDQNYYNEATIYDNVTTSFTDDGTGSTADCYGGLLQSCWGSNATTDTNRVTVSWNSVTGATSYKVYRGTSSNGENILVTTTGSTSITDTGGGSAGTPSSGSTALNVTGSTYIKADSSSTNTALDVQNSSGTSLFKIDPANSRSTFKSPTNNTTAFQIQNSSGTSLLTVDTSNSRISIGSGASPANGVLTVGTNTTANTGGIWFGTDTNLYRSGSNALKTDDSFNIAGNASLVKPTSNSTTAFQIQPQSSTTPVFNVDTTNSRIGIGTNAPNQTLSVQGSGGAFVELNTDFGHIIQHNANSGRYWSMATRDNGDYDVATQTSDPGTSYITSGNNIATFNTNGLKLANSKTYAGGGNQTSGISGGSGAVLKSDSGGNNIHFNWSGSTFQIYVDNTNVKNFIIQHPVDPNKYLVHTTLEGPENGVYYRGTAQLQGGKTDIKLPSYFEALTKKTNRTVLLTPIFEGDEPISELAASTVKNGKFTVRGVDKNNLNQKFSWFVNAERADVPDLLVEPNKDQIIVHGEGPYTYYSVKNTNQVEGLQENQINQPGNTADFSQSGSVHLQGTSMNLTSMQLDYQKAVPQIKTSSKTNKNSTAKNNWWLQGTKVGVANLYYNGWTDFGLFNTAIPY